MRRYQEFEFPAATDPLVYFANTRVDTCQGAFGLHLTIEVHADFFTVSVSNYVPLTSFGYLKDLRENEVAAVSFVASTKQRTLDKVIAIIGRPDMICRETVYYYGKAFEPVKAALGISDEVGEA